MGEVKKKKLNKNHIYKVGEVVNENLIIIKQTRDSKYNNKAYKVQSVTYPDAPTYVIRECDLMRGLGCGYTSGRRVFEGNSLYNVKNIRKYLVDEEQAKTIAPYSNSPILFKCPDCNNGKLMAPNHLQKNGIACAICSDIKRYHIYKIGEIVGNGTLEVVKQTRKGSCRAYEVQSIMYPDAPTYTVVESVLKSGCGDAYAINQRIFEGNSLYSIEWVRPYLTDIEQAKTIAPKIGKKVLFACPDCNNEKMMTPNRLLSQGFSCTTCSKNISYGQLAFGSYQEYFKLGYQSEKVLETLENRRVDFVKFDDNGNIINFAEIQGIQHTDINHKWYEVSHAQDIAKRKWAKETNTLMIEIDMRVSSWEYFKEQIYKCEHLPSINEEDEIKILKLMEENKRYPIQEIIELYERGENLIQLGKRYKVSDVTIGNILIRNNIEIRSNGKQVRCITTGEIFETVTKAREWAVKSSKIDMCCRKLRNFAGRHPNTGEKLQWEYLTDVEIYLNYKTKRLAQTPSTEVSLNSNALDLL